MQAGYITTFLHVNTPKRFATLIDGVRDRLSNRVLQRLLLYALGTPSNVKTRDIEDAVKVLTNTTKSSIGCLTDPVYSKKGFSLALAAFDKEACTVFSSSEVDHETVHVGRGHTAARRAASSDLDSPWDSSSGETGGVDDG
jgi:hypothetical protein